MLSPLRHAPSKQHHDPAEGLPVNEAINRLLTELAVGDDVTKKWPKADLLLALGFPTAARNTLCKWHWKEKDTATLAEVFELVISSDEDTRPGYLVSRLLDFRNVGRKCVLDVIHHMSGLDFGPNCNLLWKARHQRFLYAHRLKGAGEGKWSFPLTKQGRLMARSCFQTKKS